MSVKEVHYPREYLTFAERPRISYVIVVFTVVLALLTRKILITLTHI